MKICIDYEGSMLMGENTLHYTENVVTKQFL